MIVVRTSGSSSVDEEGKWPGRLVVEEEEGLEEVVLVGVGGESSFGSRDEAADAAAASVLARSRERAVGDVVRR